MSGSEMYPKNVTFDLTKNTRKKRSCNSSCPEDEEGKINRVCLLF